MIIDIATIKLVFGFARIGAPDPDSLEVVDATALAVLKLLEQLQEASEKARAGTEPPVSPPNGLAYSEEFHDGRQI